MDTDFAVSGMTNVMEGQLANMKVKKLIWSSVIMQYICSVVNLAMLFLWENWVSDLWS